MDEDAFMTQLLQGLDDSFWSAVPSPDPSPKKPSCIPSATPCTPTKSRQPAHTKQILSSTVFSADDHDITAFLEGSENWDLDADPFSPMKPSPSSSTTVTTAKAQDLNVNYPRYIPEPLTRCVVESVLEESSEDGWRKAILARVEPGEERVDIYLYDDWYQTDIRIDDTVNVLGTFSALQPSSSSGLPKRCISLTTSANLLILHPDMLLTATALSNAPQCRRKPLLTSLVRSTSDTTPALVWGSMLHEVMQRCLLEKRWDEVWIDKCLHDAISGGLGELVKLGFSEEVALMEMRERAKGFKVFAERYLGDVPKADAVLTNTRSGAFHGPSLLAISKLLDIEEDIWSPTYGLKGKLDATVLGIISDPVIPPSTSSSSSSYYKPPPSTLQERTQTVMPLPLELKTGRALAGMEHRAQTMLYTLLLSERYGVDVREGLLYYTQSEGGEVVRVPRGRNEVRGLISTRNELVGYMWRRVRRKKGKGREDKNEVQVGDLDIDMEDVVPPSSLKSSKHDEPEEEPFLPPPIDDEHACKRCYALDTCLLFRKAYSSTVKRKTKQQQEHNPPVPAFLAPIFDMKTGHLTSTQTQFFKDWERLLALEEKDLVRFKRELWTLGAKEREERGRCFGGMVLRDVGGVSGTKMIEQLGAGGEWGKESKIHRYTYRFGRSKSWVMSDSSSGPSPLTFFIQKNIRSNYTYSPSSASSSSARSLLNGHLNTGDAITVSVEPGLLALARGFILDLTPDEVVLGVDHILDLDAIRERLGRDKVQTHSASVKRDVAGGEEEVIFRIDKDELFGGMARVRNNLAQLFYADGDKRRLELVVDLRAPVFSAPPVLDVIPSAPPSSTRPTLEPTADLNPSQLNAISHVLSAEDYALILGMPGTGKTTVIAELVRMLVSKRKTVLVASYTHSAVDTILMKLSKIRGQDGGQDVEGGGFGILRLGNVDKVHPDVRKYTLNAKRTATTVEGLERQLMSPPVVATTCLSTDHALFSRRVFDYCIVDEASQITLPTCLGPLRFADKFVLVGDHNQLPPLVKNPEARRGGLDISLFRRLSDAHPKAVVDLRFQYRMNADIMLLSNRLIYNDRLKCGSEEVAGRCLKLSGREFLDRLHIGGDTELCVRRRCWLERVVAESCKAIFIDTDALPAHDSRVGDLVQNTTEAELVRQFTETLLRSGVKEEQIGIISLYKQQVKLLSHLLDDRKGIEILTADKSQGRDKDCIVVSLVRSNEAGNIGDLVKDWRRMNVSFTRARSKLVIFGSRKTLQREPLLAQFFDLMESQEWILALPPGADVAHATVFEGCSTPAKRTSWESGIVGVPVAGGSGSVREAGKVAETRAIGKENNKDERPVKRMKKTVQVVGDDPVGGGSRVGKGVLKRRPVLQDLIGNES